MSARALTSDLRYTCSHAATAKVPGTGRLRVDDQSVVTHANMLAATVASCPNTDASKGQWYCFEVDPSPAYSWFDLDGRIATLIARYLSSR